PADMARASVEQIFEYIKSVSFPNNKAKNLLGMAQTLVNEHNGEVPDSMEQLVRIPGVGRKTANVILSVVHNKPAMAVDTHVFRVSNRIGLTKNSPNVLETEKTLVANIPQKLLGIAHHWLILHGRYVCTARKPHCENCGIKNACVHFESLKNQ
ncbi:MAG: endonuclease III, partial [Muribaculaceae bacterium]|nr:endonuclease III [Muribaculaceae bacterium]